MKRDIIVTEDGSHTLYLPEMDEHYHSTHGAIQESQHVYIDAGFNVVQKQKLNIFEVGFGTGLNAWLTLLENERQAKQVNYYTIEKYPLEYNEYCQLNYSSHFDLNKQKQFQYMHDCAWKKTIEISPSFSISKINCDLTKLDYSVLPLFDLIYFDAFAPNKQNDLWKTDIFKQLYNQCHQNAILVTYSAKGEVRRMLQSVGFIVERIPGPPGKREMLRAKKECTETVIGIGRQQPDDQLTNIDLQN